MAILKRIEEIFPKEWLTSLDAAARAIPVSGVTADSRQVRPGMVFVATRGESQDGHQFIVQAAKNGAAWIVGEEEAVSGFPPSYSRVPDGRLALARLAANFYGNPSHRMLMIGVTGTSGKTTTTYLLESILKAAGYEVGLIGTVNFRYGDRVLNSTHTTPGAVELQKMLAEMRAAGCTAVVTEVSSHALKQHRAAAVAFDAMVFTNLTPEHLDFHPDMEDYYRSKSILFHEMAEEAVLAGKSPIASIFSDSEYGSRLIRELDAKKQKSMKRVLSFGHAGEVSATGLQVDLSGVRGEVSGISIRSPLTGSFNISNILGAVAAALGLGIAPEAISTGISSLASVPGRLEAVPNQRGIHVLVDYAHKPDALEKVLQTLRGVKGAHRVITVFGCGGDRDRTKRPVMGKMAAELSDQVFVTSDNPRTENPDQIIAEILNGMKGHSNYSVEPDRKKAIFQSIREAKAGDIVLIAGKGHEDYQIISDPDAPTGTRKIHFDDREVAAEALR